MSLLIISWLWSLSLHDHQWECFTCLIPSFIHVSVLFMVILFERDSWYQCNHVKIIQIRYIIATKKCVKNKFDSPTMIMIDNGTIGIKSCLLIGIAHLFVSCWVVKRSKVCLSIFVFFLNCFTCSCWSSLKLYTTITR